MLLFLSALLQVVVITGRPPDVIVRQHAERLVPEERAVIEIVLREYARPGSHSVTLEGQTSVNAFARRVIEEEHFLAGLPGEPGERIPDDVVASYDERNKVSMTLEGATLPPSLRITYPRFTAVVGDHLHTDDDWGAFHMVVSRPGISADGAHAMMTVEFENTGQTFFLVKLDGLWRIVGTGGWWIA